MTYAAPNSEQDEECTHSTGPAVTALARGAAMLGGGVLILMALMVCVSIVGKLLIPLGGHTIPGDFELVEAGTAFVVCAFLPWCHLASGHASVGVLTDKLGKRPNQIFDLIYNITLTLAACLITWQHILGLKDRIAFGGTSFTLRYPIWWAYAACLIGLVCWVCVGLALTFSDIRRLGKSRRTGKNPGASS